MGLIRASEIGLEKAEIINAMSTVLHSQLAKIAPQEFASVNSINNFIFKSPHFTVIMNEIVDLFCDRFRPKHIDGKMLSDAEFEAKEVILAERINLSIHYEACQRLAPWCLEYAASTLRRPTSFTVIDTLGPAPGSESHDR